MRSSTAEQRKREAVSTVDKNQTFYVRACSTGKAIFSRLISTSAFPQAQQKLLPHLVRCSVRPCRPSVVRCVHDTLPPTNGCRPSTAGRQVERVCMHVCMEACASTYGMPVGANMCVAMWVGVGATRQKNRKSSVSVTRHAPVVSGHSRAMQSTAVSE